MLATITPFELTSEELLHARRAFDSVSDDYLRAEHQLRQVLAKMGLFAPDEQLLALMEHFEGKVSFSNFQQFLQFLKGVHRQPEAKDADTLRAYVALGGSPDRTGSVNAEYLRFACKRFDLTIDIDKLIREVDTSRNGTIDYDEFQELWHMGRNNNNNNNVNNNSNAVNNNNNKPQVPNTDAGLNFGDSTNMTKSFWMDAVRQAHTATSEIEEELNLNGKNSLSEHNLNDTAQSSTSNVHDASMNENNNNNNNASSVRVSTILPESQQQSDKIGEENEIPKVEQLRNYLQTGSTAISAATLNERNAGAEYGRRKSNVHPSFLGGGGGGGNNNNNNNNASSAMLFGGAMGGSHGDLRSLRVGGHGASNKSMNLGSGSMMMMNRNAASSTNILAGNNNNNNNSGNVNNNHDEEDFEGGNNNNNGNINNNNGNNSSQANINSYNNRSTRGGALNYNYLPAADILPDPNATPAEVLKKAKELIEEKLRAYDSKKESQDIDDKVTQMGKQRPPVVGGISVSEKRGEGIDLPDPLTIGSSNAGSVHGGYPTSGRRAGNGGGGGVMAGGLSSARGMNNGSTTTTPRYGGGTSPRSKGWR